MKIDDNPRLPYTEYMMVQSLYQRKRPLKPAAKSSVTAVSDTKGAKFDAKG